MQFRNAIFAGGGSRCFWQLGFWEGAREAGLPLDSDVQFAASTSAGCAIATAALLNRSHDALALFLRLSRENPRNMHWHHLRPGSGGSVLPHMDMYRAALAEFLSPQDLHNLAGKELQFLVARFPGYLPAGGLATGLAFFVYALEKHLTGKIHPHWTRTMGFKPLVANAHEARDLEEFTAMILASSSVPPVLPSPPYQGAAALDGGLIDNVPAHLADDRPGQTLVLLSKRYSKPLPEIAGRTYVQPSQPILMDKFDYANPDGLQRTWEQGMQDGKTFVEQL